MLLISHFSIFILSQVSMRLRLVQWNNGQSKRSTIPRWTKSNQILVCHNVCIMTFYWIGHSPWPFIFFISMQYEASGVTQDLVCQMSSLPRKVYFYGKQVVPNAFCLLKLQKHISSQQWKLEHNLYFVDDNIVLWEKIDCSCYLSVIGGNTI